MKDDEQQRHISKYPTAHTEKQQFTPVLSFSTSRNQTFVFSFIFLIFFSQPGVQENEQNQISVESDERCYRYKFRSIWQNWCWNFGARIKCLPNFFSIFSEC
jgi:hypothetical protein